MAVFCCYITLAVDCKQMEDYLTGSIILAFIRFSCRFGYTIHILPDEGSQLVKGCNDMVINYSSLQGKLSMEYGVEYRKCLVGAHYMQIKRSKVRS